MRECMILQKGEDRDTFGQHSSALLFTTTYHIQTANRSGFGVLVEDPV